jgi:two-component system, cell cycle response regulator
MKIIMTTGDLDMGPVTLARTGVLVVDDSQVVRKAIQRILAPEFAVSEAKDGASGWDIIARDHDIQVVFSDLMMPNKNGFELLRDIRESVHPRINRLPVIIMTGHEDDEKMRRQAMLLGASDFIAKPFDSLQLKTRATVHAKADHARRQLEEAHELLAKRSNIDPLTGLVNRAGFQERAARLLISTARQGAELAVVYIELKKLEVLFKQKGRQIAEKVLTHLSRMISAGVREEDIVARVGLSRFALIMPGLNQDAAAEIVRRMLAAVRQSVYRLGDTQFSITASAALVSRRVMPSDRPETILALAEEQLLCTVRAGGDRLTISAPEASDAAASSRKMAVASDSLSLDEAISALAAGHADRIDPQLTALLAQVMPLLDYADSRLQLGLEHGLAALRDRFSAAHHPAHRRAV